MKEAKVNDKSYFYLDIYLVGVDADPATTFLKFNISSIQYKLIIPGTPPFQRYHSLRLLFKENLEHLLNGKPVLIQRLENDIIIYTYDLSKHQDSVFIYKA